MDIPTIQMIGHDYLIGPTAGQHDLPTLPSMTIHPSSLWWFIYHSTGPATAVPMDGPSKRQPFLSLVMRSLFAVTQPVSDWDSLPDISQRLCRLCSYAMDLWMPPLRPGWAPIPQLLRCYSFSHVFSIWVSEIDNMTKYHTIPTNFRKRSRLVVALTEVDGTSRNEVTFFAMIQQVLSTKIENCQCLLIAWRAGEIESTKCDCTHGKAFDMFNRHSFHVSTILQ